MRCVRIGFGKIAHIHETSFTKLGIKTIGIVENDPSRFEAIRAAGFEPYASIEAAQHLKPDFYDVCVPTHGHAAELEKIAALDPLANILIEKPICDISDIDRVRSIIRHHQGKICVNENYSASRVTTFVKEALASRQITPKRIIVEMTKHRGHDYLSGRFVDINLGAVGYEGSHLFAISGA